MHSSSGVRHQASASSALPTLDPIFWSHAAADDAVAPEALPQAPPPSGLKKLLRGLQEMVSCTPADPLGNLNSYLENRTPHRPQHQMYLPGNRFVLKIPAGYSISDYYTTEGKIGSGTYGHVYYGTPLLTAPHPAPVILPATVNPWVCSLFETPVAPAAAGRAPMVDSVPRSVALKVIPKATASRKTLTETPHNEEEDEEDNEERKNNLRLKEGWMQRYGAQLLHTALTKSHPNVVRYRQFLEDDQNMYVVMDRYTGVDLFDFIANRIECRKQYIASNRLDLLVTDERASEARASLVMRQVLSAVGFVHSVGCMHRDIKPENFIFEDKDCSSDSEPWWHRLRLVDLGSATGLDPTNNRRPMPVCEGRRSMSGGGSATDFTRKMSVVGTTGYCAPEVFRENYTEKCDLFSVGVIMFVMLSGEMPFECRDVSQYKRALQRALSRGERGLQYYLCEARDDRTRYISPMAKDLLFRLLDLNPSRRISAHDALQHPWITSYNLPRPEPNELVLSPQTIYSHPLATAGPTLENTPPPTDNDGLLEVTKQDTILSRNKPSFGLEEAKSWMTGGILRIVSGGGGVAADRDERGAEVLTTNVKAPHLL